MYALPIFREGDREIIQDYIIRFRGYRNQELVEAYNREARMGIVGVHQQQLYLYALREVMKDRFRHSPIFYESGIMGMQGEVKLVGEKVWFK